MLDDAHLLRRYADENFEPAFAELVARHIDLVYSAALRQVGGDAHRAQDVTQLVFATLARKASALRGHPALAGWLYNTTQHVARRAQRTEWRRRAREQEALRMNADSKVAAGEVDWAQIRPVLDDALRELGERDREAVVLRFLARQPFAEIGRALEVSEDAARMRVERALEKLRARFARRGMTSSASALATLLAGHAATAAPAGLAASVSGAALTSTALAGANAALGGSGMISALTSAGFFMNKSLVIISAAAVLAVGSAVYQQAAVRRAESGMSETARERDALRDELRTLRQQAAAAERSQAAATKAVNATVRSSATARAAGTAAVLPDKGDLGLASDKMRQAQERIAALNDERRQLLKSPDVLQRAVLAEERGYRALYRLAGFEPAQIEHFRTLLGRDIQRRAELQGASRAMGAEAVEDQLAAELIVDARNLFGEQTAQLIQRYQETQPLRGIAERLASNLFYTESPLTVKQAEQLVEVLARSMPSGAGTIDLGKLNAETATAPAQAILSAPQLAEFRALIGEGLWRIRSDSARATRSAAIAPK